MKAYVTVTGILFALVVVLHVWRAVVEGFGPFREPSYLLASVACIVLAVWAWRVRASLPKE